MDLGVVGAGVVGVVGAENMPVACAYDILGEDGDSDGVEDPFISLVQSGPSSMNVFPIRA